MELKSKLSHFDSNHLNPPNDTKIGIFESKIIKENYKIFTFEEKTNWSLPQIEIHNFAKTQRYMTKKEIEFQFEAMVRAPKQEQKI